MLLSELTYEERELLSRRKSPDLTARETLLLIELQTRVLLPSVPTEKQADLLAECAAVAAEIQALDFNADGMAKINSVGRKAMELHQKVVSARTG